MGLGMPGRCLVGFVWMNGNMRVKDVPKATAILLTFDASTNFWASLYF